MNTESILILRKENGDLSGISGSYHIEKLLNEYKKEQLPNADEAYHYEAEIASGFEYFIKWIKSKEK